MDSKKFGSFIAEIRREQGLTQAELAGRINVTDKAVSRWERGIGFPDINTFEPLAKALGLSVLELIKSEKGISEPLSECDAEAAVADTIVIAEAQQKVSEKKLAKATVISITAVCAAVLMCVFFLIWAFAPGFTQKSGIVLMDYSTMCGDSIISIKLGDTDSAGYIRGFKDVSEEKGKMVLRFYRAFGGLNGKIGAKNIINLLPDEDCTEIYFETSDGVKLVLIKDAETGKWRRN